MNILFVKNCKFHRVYNRQEKKIMEVRFLLYLETKKLFPFHIIRLHYSNLCPEVLAPFFTGASTDHLVVIPHLFEFFLHIAQRSFAIRSVFVRISEGVHAPVMQFAVFLVVDFICARNCPPTFCAFEINLFVEKL